jgi:hypothetical protein
MAGADEVNCYSGYEYVGRPQAFSWQGRRHEVCRVLAEWRSPDGKHYRVLAENGQVFELSYDESQTAWNIQPR